MTQTRSLIDENGKRTDGRTGDQLREIKITVGVIKNADGSAFMVQGKYIQNIWPFLIDVF